MILKPRLHPRSSLTLWWVFKNEKWPCFWDIIHPKETNTSKEIFIILLKMVPFYCCKIIPDLADVVDCKVQRYCSQRVLWPNGWVASWPCWWQRNVLGAKVNDISFGSEKQWRPEAPSLSSSQFLKRSSWSPSLLLPYSSDKLKGKKGRYFLNGEEEGP